MTEKLITMEKYSWASCIRLATCLFACGVWIASTSGLIAGPDDPAPPIPVFEPGDFDASSSTVDNQFWPIEPETIWVYEGETEDGSERIVVTVLEETREVAGVETRVLLDRVFLEGKLIEETFDWYAQDTSGNIWYFGEESFEIEDGKVVSTAGSWEAGVDGALPGHIMLADPQVGDAYRQEFYEGEAEDMGEVTALDATVTLESGEVFTDLLQTLEWTPLDPEAVENKYYATDIGLVREEQADGSQPIDLVNMGIVLAESKLIIEHNATDEDTGFQIFLDGDGWRRLDMTGPNGESNFTFEAQGSLGELGLTELFFESVEPLNAEVSVDDMLQKLPEGGYLVMGPTSEDGDTLVGTLEFLHDIPEGPELLTPEEDETVDPDEDLVLSWDPVTDDIDGDPLTIIGYQLIIEKAEPPHPHRMGKIGLSAHVPADVLSVTIPGGFLEPGTEYEWEVLAIEDNSNQTLSSSAFCTSGEGPEPVEEPPPNDPPELKAAKLIIEHNAADEDTGFQGFVDSEGWRQLVFTNPAGETILDLQANETLGNLGLTELFFETVEPENAEVPIADMLAILPEGNYTITGASMRNGEDGGTTTGTAWFTHTIPAEPELLTPEEDAVVPAADVVASWNPTTEDLNGNPVNIIAYQFLLEEVVAPTPNMTEKFALSLSIYVPDTVMSVQIPSELMENDAEYAWELLAIEESGNQTISAGSFATSAGHLPGTGGGSVTLDWLGEIFDLGDGWIFHEEHGWLFAAATSTDSIWFFDGSLGWFWTSEDDYPWLYQESSNAWLYYLEGTVDPRIFYNWNDDQYQTDQ